MENYPKQINRYKLMELLGEGGMAAVYKAYDPHMDRYVAVKLIHTSRQSSNIFLKRFEREAMALAKLSHPHIINVYDYGEENGIPYLIMEYCPSGTLKKLLGKPIPPAKAARLLLPIAQALKDTHRIGILHRDVKPANILLTETGVPMLSDFGIAKFLQSTEQTDLTTGSFGIGTPEYMAPEQGEGKPVDNRVDIYALGVVFYEMITGRKPFEADTPLSVILQHMTQPLPDPRLFVPDLPISVVNILKKALEKNPDLRYQSMGAFASDLESVAHSGMTTPLATPSSFVNIPNSQQKPVPPKQTQSEQKPDYQRSKKKNMLSIAGIIVIVSLCFLIIVAGGLYLALNPHSGKNTGSGSPPPQLSTQTSLPFSEEETLQTCVNSLDIPQLTNLTSMAPLYCQTFTNDENWNLTLQTNPLVTYQTNIINGKLVFETTAIDRFVLYTPLPVEQSFSDFGFSLEAKKSKGGTPSSYGVIFRCSNDQISQADYYYLRITDSIHTYSLHLHKDGSWIDLQQPTTSDIIHTNNWNQITIIAQGDTIDFIINEQSLFTIIDSNLQTGSMGIAVESSQSGEEATFEFDNFLLMTP